jgi:hypothetical protein
MIHFGEGRVSIVGSDGERIDLGTARMVDLEYAPDPETERMRREWEALSDKTGEFVLRGKAKSARFSMAEVMRLFGLPRPLRARLIRKWSKRIAREGMKAIQRKRRNYVSNAVACGTSAAYSAKARACILFTRRSWWIYERARKP